MRKFEQEPEVAEMLRKLGHDLRDERYGEGLTQDALASRSGIDQGTISRLERGLGPGLRFASYARLREVLGYRRRRAAKTNEVLAELWAEGKPPWELSPEERLNSRAVGQASDPDDGVETR